MNDYPEAFPTPLYCDNERVGHSNGMSLRDYFAAKAMAALLVSEPEAKASFGTCAEWAYQAADAMLAERDK